MKVIDVGEAESHLGDCLAEAQRERVVITRDGKPTGLLTGVEGYDLEDLFYASDPDFWKMIEERRRQPTVDQEQVDRLLAR